MATPVNSPVDYQYVTPTPAKDPTVPSTPAPAKDVTVPATPK